MHRIANLPREEPTENFLLVEQPNAPVLFLSSCTSDISALSTALDEKSNIKLNNKIVKIHYIDSESITKENIKRLVLQ